METLKYENGIFEVPSKERVEFVDEVYEIACWAEEIANEANTWTHILLVMDLVQMLFIVYLLYRG